MRHDLHGLCDPAYREPKSVPTPSRSKPVSSASLSEKAPISLEADQAALVTRVALGLRLSDTAGRAWCPMVKEVTMGGKHAKREEDAELEKVASQEEPEEGETTSEAEADRED